MGGVGGRQLGEFEVAGARSVIYGQKEELNHLVHPVCDMCRQLVGLCEGLIKEDLTDLLCVGKSCNNELLLEIVKEIVVTLSCLTIKLIC